MSEQINRKCPFCGRYFEVFEITYCDYDDSFDSSEPLVRSLRAQCHRCVFNVSLDRKYTEEYIHFIRMKHAEDPFIKRWNWLTEPSDVVKEKADDICS